MTRPPFFRLLVSLAALAVAVLCLHWLARFDLRGPTGLSGAELARWSDDPVTVVATVCRWLALAAGWYLIVVVAAIGLLGVPARHAGWRRLVPTPVVGALGAALGLSAVVLPAAAHLHTSPPEDTGPAMSSTLRMDNVSPLTLAPVQTDGSETIPRRGAHPLTDALPPTVAAVEVPDDVTEVRPGDSFWSLAEEHLEDEWGRRNLTDAEIAPYWRTLIEANRAELTDPENPDLLLPGQRLRLPPAPSETGSG